MTASVFWYLDQTFEEFCSENETLVVLGGILFLIILIAACSSSGSSSGSSSSGQNTKLPVTPENLRRYDEEVSRIKQTAEPLRSTRLIAELYKRIRSLDEQKSVRRIDIGTEAVTVVYRNDPDTVLVYHRMGLNNLNAADCIPCACALQEKLGDCYHVRFQNGQMMPSVILNPYDLKDPKEKLTS